MENPAQQLPRRPPRGQSLLGQSARAAVLVLATFAITAALWFSLAGSLAGARVAVYPRPQVAIELSSAGAKLGVNIPVSFTARATAGRDLTYTWNFGDGTIAQGPTALHTYENFGRFTIALDATDPTGQEAGATNDVTISPPAPLALFSWTTDPTSPLLVDFSADASSGDNLSYTWSFGDMVSGMRAGSDVQHAYEQPGNYQATLTVSDPFGQSASSSREVTLKIGTAQVSVSISAVAGSPRTYIFIANMPDDQDPTGVVYRWEFGDGAVADGVTARHTYPHPGTYTVALMAVSNTSTTPVTSQPLTVP